MIRQLALALMLVLPLCLARADARPYTVDDLVKQESFGEVALDPTGRYLVVERRGPYDSAASFDLQHRNPLGASRLLLSDLAGDPAGRPLMPQPPGYGYVAGPWSPDGRRLAVLRIGRGGWELGVATPSQGGVLWLGVTPGSAAAGRSLVWETPQTLLVLARPSDDGPWELRAGSQSARRLPPRWAAAAAGEAAYTVVGSGAYLQAAAIPPPTRLLRIDLQSGVRRTLAVGAFTDMELAPGGAWLALLERGERLQPAADRPPQGPWGVGTETHRLAVLNLATQTLLRPCEACDLLDTLLVWSPSGERLLVYARPPQAPWTQGAFRLFETQSKQLKVLPADGLAPAFRFRPEAVETGWLGETPVVKARVAGQRDARADWWRLSARGPQNLTAALPGAPGSMLSGQVGVKVLAGGQLWAVSVNRKPRLLITGQVEPFARPSARPGQRLGYQAGGQAAALLLRAAAGQVRLGDGRDLGVRLEADETPVAYSPAVAGLVTLRISPRGEAWLQARRPGRAPVVISSLNQTLNDIDLPRLVPIHHAGPQGQALVSWLYLPPANPAGLPPPLIVRPYLGETYSAPPPARPAILNFVIDAQVLVGHGYAVLSPSLPLSMDAREPLAGVGERILAVVDAAARQAPGAFDPQRLALWGHSYGGYTTLGAISQTDRFKAAIAMNAPSDLISLYGSFQPSWRVSPEDGLWPAYAAGFFENSQGRMGAPPWRAMARYARNSPVLQVETIHTPVMLIHGDQDPIGISQSEEMFSALFRLRRDAVLVTYWGEGHVIASPGNVRDLYRRAFVWLDAHLSRAQANCRRPACSESGT